jgi:dihydrofolate reductase
LWRHREGTNLGQVASIVALCGPVVDGIAERVRCAPGSTLTLLGRRMTTTEGAVMGKLIVQEWMAFDGVIQAPGDPDEDTSGGFAHGGWHLRYFDDGSMQWVVDNLNGVSGFVLGRRTYEGFARHWPNATAEEQPVAEPLNNKPKYVASTTLQGPLDWQNSTLLHGDLGDAIHALKKHENGDLLLIGSATLAQALIKLDLVDEFRLMIDPLLVGGGKRLFPEDGVLRPLESVGNEVTTTGATLATYVSAAT